MKASTEYYFEKEILNFNYNFELEDIDRVIKKHNPYKLYLNSRQRSKFIKTLKKRRKFFRITFQGMTFYKNVLIMINFKLDDESILIVKKIITTEKIGNRNEKGKRENGKTNM